jgi:hypothetical protein
MHRRSNLAGPLALGLFLLATGPAMADRVPSTKAIGPATAPVRNPVFVPYTTNGYTTLGAYSVAPRIYSSPTVSDPTNPNVRPVFNLPFYGSRQSFGSRSNGAVSVPGAIPLPNR